MPDGGDAALERIWVIVPGEADGLCTPAATRAYCSRADDGGATLGAERGLWEQPQPAEWSPGAGGLCLHSIAPWPGDPDRLAVGISAAGVWLTDDGGADLAHAATRASSPRYLPEEAREERRSRCASTTCSARRRGRSGCSCSSTAASTAPTTPARRGSTSPPACRRTSASRWSIDPADPDSAYVIPLTADIDRVTPDGRRARLRDARRRRDLDAARRRPPGRATLPHDPARRRSTRRRRRWARALLRCDVGSVFGSADAGTTWFDVATHLPPVLSVAASRAR